MTRCGWLALTLVALVVVAFGGSQSLAGKGGNGGGGKKPPPDEPPADPAITYISTADGEAGLAVMNEDGSNRTVLLYRTTDLGPDGPCWSPDGTQLAFRYDDGVNGPGLYTLDVLVDGDLVFGENLTMIAALPAGQNFAPNPAWSPVPVFGKERIAFSRLDEDTGLGWIHLVNADGSGELTNLGKYRGDASWSPDGSRLASTPDSQSIKVHHLVQDEPGGPVRVGYSPRYDLFESGERQRVYRIDWAKTQDHVLAAQVGRGFISDLWIVDLRDGVLSPDTPPEDVDVFFIDERIALTSTSDISETHPTWSPNDLALLFKVDGARPRRLNGLYMLEDLSGSGTPAFLCEDRCDDVNEPDWRR